MRTKSDINMLDNIQKKRQLYYLILCQYNNK